MGCRFLIWEVPWELFLVNNKVNYYTYTLQYLPFSIKLEWNSNRMILIRKESKFGDSNHNILRLNYCKCKSPLCWSSVQEYFCKFVLKKGGKGIKIYQRGYFLNYCTLLNIQWLFLCHILKMNWERENNFPYVCLPRVHVLFYMSGDVY